MQQSTAAKIGLLLALYFAQGLPFGFQTGALPILLREQGMSLASIGLASALALPWMLKIFWAPLVDRFGSARFGRRKSWIVPTQCLMALVCLSAAMRPTHLPYVVGCIFVLNLLAATQDIAVDGLAVDILKTHELGPGNGAQTVGYKIGMLVGGGFLVYLTQFVGWCGLFLTMAALMVAVAMMSLRCRENGQGDVAGGLREAQSVRETWRRLMHQVQKRGGVLALILIATYKTGEYLIDAMFKPYLIDAGFSAAQVGLWVATFGVAFSLAGSAAGAVLARGVAIERALLGVAILRVFPLAGEVWLTTINPTELEVLGVTCAEHFVGGALTTVMFAFMMSRVERDIGATHFTFLATAEAAGKAPAMASSGFIAESLGYTGAFGVGLALSIAYVAVVLLTRPSFRVGAIGGSPEAS